MNCEMAHQHIVSAAYGELPDELVHDLDRHIAHCDDCAAEREQLRALRTLADANPVREPDPNLVARSRVRLTEALDRLPPKRWYDRLAELLGNNVASLQSAPIAAALLVIAGLGGGALGGFEYSQARAAKAALNSAQSQVRAIEAMPPDAGPAEIANVASIVRQPNSEFVQVRYNQLVPRTVNGSLDDPQIRQLLMMASEQTATTSLRGDSVAMLADECRAGHSCQSAGIRDALLITLRYDSDPGVRAKALGGLEPYVTQDRSVRDAVLEALMNDADPRVRSMAINILQPIQADTSVRQVLNSVANSDSNPSIRTVSRQVLSREPEIQ